MCVGDCARVFKTTYGKHSHEKMESKKKCPILDDKFCIHIIYNIQRYCVYMHMCMCVAGIVLGFFKLPMAYANMYKNIKNKHLKRTT